MLILYKILYFELIITIFYNNIVINKLYYKVFIFSILINKYNYIDCLYYKLKLYYVIKTFNIKKS